MCHSSATASMVVALLQVALSSDGSIERRSHSSKRLKRLPNWIWTNWHFQRPLDAFFETLNLHWIFIHDFRLCRLKSTYFCGLYSWIHEMLLAPLNVFTLLFQSLQFPLLIYISNSFIFINFDLVDKICLEYYNQFSFATRNSFWLSLGYLRA